ncbi:unnamed protein product [Urochloa decumbens]|uniref:Uncharacterized protein n=1 Tax=Urochloa decumbens TaxID=240449 RepID=A0ABC9E5U1_9POAL
MAVRSCGVAVLVLLLVLALAASPPCAAAARVLPPADVVVLHAGGGEAPDSGDRTDGSAAGSGLFRGSPPGFGGRRMAAAAGNAARVMGSVPSPGVGH